VASSCFPEVRDGNIWQVQYADVCAHLGAYRQEVGVAERQDAW
jgi:hypothetical protein